MEKLRWVMVEQEETEDILCNKCGKSVKKKHNYEYALLSAEWGFESKRDGITQIAHLCETCWNKLISTFKIVPEEEDSYNA